MPLMGCCHVPAQMWKHLCACCLRGGRDVLPYANIVYYCSDNHPLENTVMICTVCWSELFVCLVLKCCLMKQKALLLDISASFLRFKNESCFYLFVNIYIKKNKNKQLFPWCSMFVFHSLLFLFVYMVYSLTYNGSKSPVSLMCIKWVSGLAYFVITLVQTFSTRGPLQT